jgi:AcrR family transcriptional regulator
MENGPRQRLVAHFEELIRQARQQPEMFVVLAEINARSMRDPAVHSVVAKNDRGWKRFLMEILQEGIRKKEFQAWLDADTAAEAIISLVRGLSVTCAGRADAMERPLRQLAAWLVVK